MSVLGVMTRRDLRAGRGQVVAMVATMLLGVALFGASYDAFLNLQDSYASLYEQTHFADLTVAGSAGDRFASTARSVQGVATIEQRRVADVPVRIGGEKLMGRIIGRPADGEPALNQVLVLDGILPAAASTDEVLLDQHVAKHFDIDPGDEIEVFGSTGWTVMEVVGVIASPEYVWPARSRQEILTPPGEFGIVFAPEPVLDALGPIPTNSQVLVGYSPGADTAGLDEMLTTRASELGLTAITRADQPSNAALQEDVKGFGELSFLFPVLFLGTAGMALYVMLTRLVYSQRPMIGLMRASGFSRRTISRHYLIHGVVVGLAGGIPGAVIGVVLAGTVSNLYTSVIDVPVTVIRFRPVTVAAGLGFALVAGALGALGPSILASRVEPAAAMRGEVPSGGLGRRSLVESIFPPVRRLPTRWLMVLRGVGRNRRRTISTVIGVTLAMVLILVSWGMLDTTQVLLERQFQTVQRQDAELVLYQPADPTVLSTLTAVSGVEAVESTFMVDAVIETGGESYLTVAQAFQPDTSMHTFLSPDGGDLDLPEDGVLVGVALRSILNVAEDDIVSVDFPGSGTSAQARVGGFVDEPLGTFIYLSQEHLTALAGDTISETAPPMALVRYEPEVDREAVRDRLESLDEVVAIRDSLSLYETAQSFMGLFYAFIGVMLVFGGIMAFALILSSVSANVSERDVELATLSAAGAGRRLLGRLVAGENIALTLLGIPTGVVVGYLVSASFMSTFSSDLFQFDLHMRPLTPVWAALGVLVASLVSLWPATRVVRNIDVAALVRQRSL